MVIGIVFGLVGVFWHVPHVTRTDGVIVESIAVAGGQMKRLITYDYTAYGVRHRGQRLLGWGRQYPGMFKTGDSFPVYFVTDKPGDSYAPFPPRMTGWIVFGVPFTAVGLTIIISVRRIRQQTSQSS